jgi:hypothetical protein
MDSFPFPSFLFSSLLPHSFLRCFHDQATQQKTRTHFQIPFRYYLIIDRKGNISTKDFI